MLRMSALQLQMCPVKYVLFDLFIVINKKKIIIGHDFKGIDISFLNRDFFLEILTRL